VKLSDRFLDDGAIVSTRGRSGDDTRVFKAEKGDTLPPWPVAVLVNEATASASEIFAGAMKDRGRGVIVGARTFGKGSVQTPFPLPDGSFLKVTTARYYTPKGISVHREEGKKAFGIDPDHLVEMTAEEYDRLKAGWNAERVVKGEAPKEPEAFVDIQLQAAIEVVRAGLEGRPPKVQARVLKKEKAPEE
jgi:carboxyl-terminal processing protease